MTENAENALLTPQEAVLNVRSQLPTLLQRTQEENVIVLMGTDDQQSAMSIARLATLTVDTAPRSSARTRSASTVLPGRKTLYPLQQYMISVSQPAQVNSPKLLINAHHPAI
jgi:hypothetical protein